MSTPCTRMAVNCDTGISAIASRREASASLICRAKNSTVSEVLVFTIGALMASVDTGRSRASLTKPGGKFTCKSAPLGSDDAITLPAGSSSATWRTSMFCRMVVCKIRLACGTSIHSATRIESESMVSMLDSSTSTPSRLRLMAASAPLTKRSAWASLSASAALRFSPISSAAMMATSTVNSSARLTAVATTLGNLGRITSLLGGRHQDAQGIADGLVPNVRTPVVAALNPPRQHRGHQNFPAQAFILC